MAHVIKRGLNIPIAGQPVQTIASGPEIGSVGLLGDDYVGMRPTMFVKEGDRVQIGQRIATMGSTGTDRVKLHFEIRRDGKPVNPLRYLPR